MNIHKNARTTPQSRALLVHRVVQEHWPVSAVAIAFGVSQRTVYKWLARVSCRRAAGPGRPLLASTPATARLGPGLDKPDTPVAAG